MYLHIFFLSSFPCEEKRRTTAVRLFLSKGLVKNVHQAALLDQQKHSVRTSLCVHIIIKKEDRDHRALKKSMCIFSIQAFANVLELL